MKKYYLIITLAALLAAALIMPQGALAQQKTTPSPTPAVKVTPVVPATPAAQKTVKTIFDFEKEIGLSADQSKKLKDSVKSFNEEIKSLNEKQKQANKELSDLINGTAALDKIKEKLQQIGAIELDIRMANIRLTRTVNETLTKEQSAKWKDIQKRERGGK